VKDEHRESYEKVLETMELEPGLVGRKSSVMRGVEVKLLDLKTSNLIFVFSEFGFSSSSGFALKRL
jgi:hypothetical protein